MSKNNNLSPLPVYSNIAEQDFRKPWAYGDIPHLKFKKGIIPPFFVRVATGTSSATLTMKTPEGTTVASGITSSNLKFVTKNGITMMYCELNTSVISSINQGGQYYFVISAGGGTYYTEVFTFVSDVDMADRTVTVEWYSDKDQEFADGFIPYENGFKGKLFIDSNVGMPDYLYDEEAIDRDGYKFLKKQVSEKVYKFTFVAPEYVCDVMRAIRLADHITVTDAVNRVYSCDDFLVNVAWLEQGHYARADVEFQTDSILKTIAKGGTGGGTIAVTLAPPYYVFPVAGGTVNVAVSGAEGEYTEWSVESPLPSGISCVITDGVLSVTKTANLSVNELSGRVVFVDGIGRKATFNYKQEAVSLELSRDRYLFPTNLAGTVPTDGQDVPDDDVEVVVRANAGYSVTANNMSIYIRSSQNVYTLVASPGGTYTNNNPSIENLVFVPTLNSQEQSRTQVQNFQIGGTTIKTLTLIQPEQEVTHFDVTFPTDKTFAFGDKGIDPVNGLDIPATAKVIEVDTNSGNWSITTSVTHANYAKVYERLSNGNYIYLGLSYSITGLSGSKTLVIVSQGFTEPSSGVHDSNSGTINWTLKDNSQSPVVSVTDTFTITAPIVIPYYYNEPLGGTIETTLNLIGDWSLSVNNGATIFPNSGTGATRVAITVPANTSIRAYKSYNITGTINSGTYQRDFQQQGQSAIGNVTFDKYTLPYMDEGEAPRNGFAVPESDVLVTVETNHSNWYFDVPEGFYVYRIDTGTVYTLVLSAAGRISNQNGNKSFVLRYKGRGEPTTASATSYTFSFSLWGAFDKTISVTGATDISKNIGYVLSGNFASKIRGIWNIQKSNESFFVTPNLGSGDISMEVTTPDVNTGSEPLDLGYFNVIGTGVQKKISLVQTVQTNALAFVYNGVNCTTTEKVIPFLDESELPISGSPIPSSCFEIRVRSFPDNWTIIRGGVLQQIIEPLLFVKGDNNTYTPVQFNTALTGNKSIIVAMRGSLQAATINDLWIAIQYPESVVAQPISLRLPKGVLTDSEGERLPSTLNFASTGESKVAKINMRADWNITAPDWVTVTPSASVGSTNVAIIAGANTTGSARTGSLIVTNNLGTVIGTYTCSQGA